jgi:hypothetical protein
MFIKVKDEYINADKIFKIGMKEKNSFYIIYNNRDYLDIFRYNTREEALEAYNEVIKAITGIEQ